MKMSCSCEDRLCSVESATPLDLLPSGHASSTPGGKTQNTQTNREKTTQLRAEREQTITTITDIDFWGNITRKFHSVITIAIHFGLNCLFIMAVKMMR